MVLPNGSTVVNENVDIYTLLMSRRCHRAVCFEAPSPENKLLPLFRGHPRSDYATGMRLHIL